MARRAGPGVLLRRVAAAALLAAVRRAPAADAPGGATVAYVYEVVPGASGPLVRETSGRDAPGMLPRAALTPWVESAARSVTAYFGRFPTAARIFVERAPSGRIGHGVTRRGRPPAIRISLGPAATAADLEDDWVLTHEMVHLSFPSVGSHPWLGEGVAVYVEPIARAKVGAGSPQNVWRWLVWGLPKGLPAGQDHGLDTADTWGRTYWGGALFCFLADVEIRRATANRRSLGDALRAILDTCGGVSELSTIDEVVAAGDGAVGHPVLRELYDRLGRAPGTVDLAELFRILGVSGSSGGLRFDDGAPYAPIRRALATDTTDSAAVSARILLREGTWKSLP